MNEEQNEIGFDRRRKTAVFIIRGVIALAALVVFGVYCAKHIDVYALQDFVMPLILLALFSFVAMLAAPKLAALLSGENEFSSVCEEDGEDPKIRFAVIVLAALLLHALTFIVGVWIYAQTIGIKQGWLAACWRDAWMKPNTDAGHYLTIARDWYVTEGDDRLLLVFFPLFPILIRLFNFIIGDSYISALVINSAAVSLACGMIYLTLRKPFGSRTATVAAFIAMLLPGAIFFNSPMTEPLFLLFTVSAFYFAQEKRYLPAGIMTCLAGMTRSLGVLMCVPILLMGIGDIIGRIKAGKKISSALTGLIAGLMIGVCGTLFYLYINYSLYGNALKFLEFQAENWSQRSCPFFDTARYVFSNFIKSTRSSPMNAYTLWLPQLIAIFGSLALIAAEHKKLPASYTVFFLCYFAVSVGCTWLLSAVRYLSVPFPVITAFALLCRKRTGTAAVFVSLAVIYLIYTVMYMHWYSVY